MYKILRDFEESICDNLNTDTYFNGTEKIYFDLVITKDLSVLIIPNRFKLPKPILDIDIKGFEAVIIPTGEEIDNLAPNISVESIKKIVPSDVKIYEFISSSQELVDKLINYSKTEKEKYERTT